MTKKNPLNEHLLAILQEEEIKRGKFRSSYAIAYWMQTRLTKELRKIGEKEPDIELILEHCDYDLYFIALK